MLDIRKLLFCCLCSLAALASVGVAGNVMVNGTLDTDSSGWMYVAAGGGLGLMHADYVAEVGNPAGSVKCWVDDRDAPSGTNNYRFGQVLRVNKGQKYKLDGDWQGDLTGLVGDPDPNYANARNWAEIFVGFYDHYPNPDTEWGSIAYKKTYGGGGADTPWAWTSILGSAQAGFPSNGVFTATGQYMTVAINVGGRTKSCDPAHPVWVYIDNFKVLPCHDEAGTDCSADLKYLAWIANNWLSCNIDPPTSCY
jgi:hypothetical protein